MEYVVLGLLLIKPMTIYELNQAFKTSISLFYSASYGSLQNAVKKLNSSKLIDTEERLENGRNKKIFTINTNGQDAFFDWMMDDVPTQKLEVTALSKLNFLGLLPSKVERNAVISNIVKGIEKVESELNQLSNELADLNIDESYKGIFKYQLLTLKYGIASHEMAKKWFEDIYEE